jgi:hypothetical protein
VKTDEPFFTTLPDIISLYPARKEEKTIIANDTSISDDTWGPLKNVRSQYAMRIIVKFLNIVTSGIERCCKAFDPVYIMATNANDTGYHVFAVFEFRRLCSKSPSFLKVTTKKAVIPDWNAKSKKLQ